jgi:hypothetical protein
LGDYLGAFLVRVDTVRKILCAISQSRIHVDNWQVSLLCHLPDDGVRVSAKLLGAYFA